MANARDQWPARAASPVRRHPGQRDVAQRSPSSVAALPSRPALGGAEKVPAAGKAAGLESEPCATGSQQIHSHEDVAVIKERAPQPGRAIKLRAMRSEATKDRAGERWRTRKAADLQDRSALRLLRVGTHLKA